LSAPAIFQLDRLIVVVSLPHGNRAGIGDAEGSLIANDEPGKPILTDRDREAELGQDAGGEFGEVHGAAAVDEEVTVWLDGHWGDLADHGHELFSSEVSSLVEVVRQAFTQSSVGDVHPRSPRAVDEGLAARAEVALGTQVAYSADLA
jgi:hypothetical protein